MNIRLIVYGLIGVVLFMMLQEGEVSQDTHPFSLLHNSRTFFQTECMKEIVDLNGSYKAKVGFCDCVVSNYSQKLTEDTALKENFDGAVAEYNSLNPDAYARSRFLAHKPSDYITTGNTKLDQLLRSYRFKYNFKELNDRWNSIAKEVDRIWGATFVSCSTLVTAEEAKTN